MAEAAAGLDANGDPALAHGVIDVPQAGVVTTSAIPTSVRLPSGACCVLQAETTFEVWVVAEVRGPDSLSRCCADFPRLTACLCVLLAGHGVDK